MNNWDKVEKSKRVATEQDIYNEYIKGFIWIILGVAYFYFIIMGWSL
tara:strand:- start:313 stop:453 length:141 start_codon:yes stop_codon:yes gene_type:complete